MIELSTKLTQTAFSEASKSKAGKSAGETPKAEFNQVIDKAFNKDVGEVVKVLDGMDIKPQQDVTAIQTQSLENVSIKGEETSPSNATQKISEIMGEVNDGQVKLERLVDLVASGQKLSPQELIAIQAGVFSLVQELELVSKATQEATQGVRQTLNTNLG